MLVVFLAVCVGLAVGVALAWLVLSGLLAMVFRRARTVIRRMIERRRDHRPSSERRQQDRRKP
ncbi:MAG: hypothetical protein DMF80_21000 [Acidobacteria bacterium]|nr:MAG: hypothetical protein DMF80_21000 [Acidobacteriota bacterium]